jgi:Na+/melibiose symporter-like transporter
MMPLPPSARIGFARERISLRSAYGAGHFAKSLAWSFPELLLPYYANMRLGLSAGDTGLLIFVSATQGAATDIGAAYLLRQAEGYLNRVLIIQFLTGLVTAGALLIVFSPVRVADASFLYLIAALTLFRTAYAFYDVSQNALVSLLPEDEDDAHRYIVLRQTLSGLARLVVAGLAFLLVGNNAPAGGREIVAAVAMAVLIVVTAGWILRWKSSARPATTPTPKRKLSTPVGLTRLLLAGAALAGPEAMALRMVPFVEGRGPDDHTGAALLFVLVFGTVIGPLALPRPGKEAMRSALAFTALSVLAAVVFFATTRWLGIALIACFAHGVGMGGMLALFWREMSMAIRNHADRTGVRTDMIAFALLTATIKLSGAVSGAGLGLLLNGFKAGAPTAMLGLAGIIAVGGLIFLLALAPSLRINGARQRYCNGGPRSGLRRATPPPGSRTT